MCEPSHSIIQYSDPHDPDDDDMSGSAQAGSFSISQLTSGLTKWSKKIQKWLHLSMMGQGHSETIGERGGVTMYNYHTIFSLYEAHWWNRSVKPDGGSARSHGIQYDCAKEYAHLVSIGDMTQLRRFLETSIKNSDRPEGYVRQIRESLLNGQGKIQFDSKLGGIFKVKPTGSAIESLVRKNLGSMTKFALGFVRKRDLLVPEWADDNRIWTPRMVNS